MIAKMFLDSAPPQVRQAHPLSPRTMQAVSHWAFYNRALFEHLLQMNSVLSIISSATVRPSPICEGLAALLSQHGRSVVIIPSEAILETPMNVAPDPDTFLPGKAPKVWIWYAGVSPTSPVPSGFGEQESWLTMLCRKFDSVLLDWSGSDGGPNGPRIWGTANSALLVAEAGRTSRKQLIRDQETLTRQGAKLLGCILLED